MSETPVTIATEYTGGLRTRATHLKSGETIITDAPLDNQGKGEAFSPTDLLAASLGSCMLTIMGISAREHGFDIDGTRVNITKIMGTNPRRVQEVIIDFTFPHRQYTPKQQKLIALAADTCPVARSLHPDLKQTIRLNF
ncbi:MAG TPA: OsmC family protein [Bacteroidales bacterium]|nr:OsmC family protein [Bacteroidales bacterium]HRZ48316.1 OsmC family protein [Bacteroidales bacterium]